MKILYSTIFVLIFSVSALQAQGQNDRRASNPEDIQSVYKGKADKEFDAFRYRTAIEFYLLSDTTAMPVIEKLASSYYLVKDYVNAEKWYGRGAGNISLPDEFSLRYAEVLANNQKYVQSEKWYSNYLSKHPSDKRAANLSRLTKDLPGFYRDSADWKIDYLSVNTPDDEFSPAYFGRGLIFSSNRALRWGVSNVFGWNETRFTDLYIADDTTRINLLPPADYFHTRLADIDATKAHKQRLPNSVNDNRVLGDITYPRAISDVTSYTDSSGVKLLRGGVNTKFHDGPTSFTEGQYYMAYTRNHFDKSSQEDKKNGIYKLNLYSVRYTGGTWHDKKPLPFNNTDYSTAHPALSSDGRVLYFVSDKPGGFGGKDLYYVVRADQGNGWSEPVNLGPSVNTEGDELFPFLSGNMLYFSSTGHAGLGGLDIFKAELEKDLPKKSVLNLGYPVNSSKDDFGIILAKGGRSGYFSSNRYGSDDIFRFAHQPSLIKLEGQVLTDYAGGKRVVENADVRISAGGTVDSIRADAMGRFSKVLQRNLEYKVEASKENYSRDEKNVSTNDIKTSSVLYTELLLKAPDQLYAAGTSDCELKRIFKIDNIYYDLDKSFIRPDAQANLNKLAALMRQYPSVTVMAASHCDSRASLQYNIALSLRRSESSKRYLVAQGISPDRIRTAYFGESHLTNHCADGVNCTEHDQQLNRRTEFLIFRDGRELTGIPCDQK